MNCSSAEFPQSHSLLGSSLLLQHWPFHRLQTDLLSTGDLWELKRLSPPSHNRPKANVSSTPFLTILGDHMTVPLSALNPLQNKTELFKQRPLQNRFSLLNMFIAEHWLAQPWPEMELNWSQERFSWSFSQGPHQQPHHPLPKPQQIQTPHHI